MDKILGFFRAILNFFKTPKAEQPLLPDPKHEDGRELPAENELRKVRLAVIVGHTVSAQGATMHGTRESEYKYNGRVAKLMQEIAKASFPSIEVHIVTRDGVGISGAYKIADEKLKADLCIELHFNAANTRARGTETLCTSDMNDVEFAHLVQKQMVRAFGRQGSTDRGVKAIARSARGGGNVHAFPGGANCLVEPFFGDNKEDAELGNSRIRLYAEALLQGVQLYAEKRDLVSKRGG